MRLTISLTLSIIIALQFSLSIAKDILSTPPEPAGPLPTIEAPAGQTEKTEKTVPSRTETRTIAIDETETPSGFVSELSDSYLIWKDEQGNLGFGNVQYPKRDQFAIATPSNWFNVKRHPEEEGSGSQETMTSKGETDLEAVAIKFSGQYLVWKDRDGNIGFGNTQYPGTAGIEYVNIDGAWYKYKITH